MSNQINSELLERALEIRESFTGTLVEGAIDEAIKRNDLEQLRHLVAVAEGDLAQDELYGAEALDNRDIYEAL